MLKTLKLLFALCAGLCLLLPLTQQVQADPITGVYRITSKVQPGMCFDVDGFKNANSTNVLLWYANHTNNQQWLVERQSDGAYKIYAYSGQNSLQMLDDANGSTADGNTVATYEDNNNDAQRWYFVDMGNGFYRIVPKNAGLPNPVTAATPTLDVRNGNNAKQGDSLNIYHYTGTNNQLFRLDWAGPSVILPNSKKGVGGRPEQTGALNVSWYYTWGPNRPTNTPSNVEFVPMDWGYWGGDNTGYVNQMKNQFGVQNLLAFNEPDHTDQAHMSVQQAFDCWPSLQASGLNLISPACADDNDDWFQQFMNGVPANNLRLDAIAVHCYIRDPIQFENYIINLHNWRWQYPIWITEFAPTDWASPSGVTTAEAANFMKIVVPWLNGQWYVQRYAWYTGSSPGTGTLGSAALVNGDGSLTDLGRLYSRM